MFQTHADRKREIFESGGSVRMGTPEFAELREITQKQLDEMPEVKKFIRKQLETGFALWIETLSNGAGLSADKAVRDFYNAVNNRLLDKGLHQLPICFNVFEAFMKFKPMLNVFSLLPEVDHSFSVFDFVDFITSSDAPDDPYASAYLFEEGKIYNYSSFEEPNKIIISTEDGSDYGISSFSLVRRGDELAVIVVAGEDVPLDLVTEAFQDENLGVKNNPFNSDEVVERAANPLENTKLWRTVALTRLNLSQKTIDVRYLMHDFTDTYFFKSDDPDLKHHFISQGKNSEYVDEHFRESSEYLDSKGTLFEIAKMAILLPAYFKFKISMVKKNRVYTQVTKDLNRRSLLPEVRKKIAARVQEKKSIIFRRVSSLQIIRSPISNPIGHAYSPPSFQVEVSGFWRRLHNPESVGKDPQGQDITGRTWVNSHVRWRDKPLQAQKVVYIKSKVSAARRIAEFEANFGVTLENVRDIGTPGRIPTEKDATERQAGYLYILTNAALGQDIFKVGITTREPEARAKELSSSSGVPVPFLVAESWRVSDIRKAESYAHAALEKFRVNQKREFFQASFSIVRKTVENAIQVLMVEMVAA